MLLCNFLSLFSVKASFKLQAKTDGFKLHLLLPWQLHFNLIFFPCVFPIHFPSQRLLSLFHWAASLSIPSKSLLRLRHLSFRLLLPLQVFSPRCSSNCALRLHATPLSIISFFHWLPNASPHYFHPLPAFYPLIFLFRLQLVSSGEAEASVTARLKDFC